jgi:single-stranded-DNA-specific exonuclease
MSSKLVDENRTYVYFGMKVLAKTKRPGLKALMAVSGVDPESINTRSLGYRLGPRMNAAGRLETAKHALDMLLTNDPMEALEKAEYLDDLNRARRVEQDKIFKQAVAQAEKHINDSVLVVSGIGLESWRRGDCGVKTSRKIQKTNLCITRNRK